MTQNDFICLNLSTAVRMLDNFGLEGVLLSFHSSRSFCLSLFRRFLWVSFSAPLVVLRKIFCLMFDFRYLEIFFHVFSLMSSLWLAFSRNLSRFHFFWMLLFTSSLYLMVCIKCPSIPPSVCSSNSQSFDFSRSRAGYVTTLSPSIGLSLLNVNLPRCLLLFGRK